MEGIRTIEVRVGCKKCGYPGNFNVLSCQYLSFSVLDLQIFVLSILVLVL